MITHAPGQLTFEWASNPVNDMVADSALAVVLRLVSTPLALDAKVKSEPRQHAVIKREATETVETKISLEDREPAHHIKDLLAAQYGDILHDEDAKQLVVSVDDTHAIINVPTLTVECANVAFKERVSAILSRIKLAVFPVPTQ